MVPVMEKKMRLLVDDRGVLHTSVSLHDQTPAFCTCCGSAIGPTGASTFESISLFICGNCNHIMARLSLSSPSLASRSLKEFMSAATAKGASNV